jgi:hypothetical protein
MKKLILLSTAFALFTGVAFAEGSKGKKKKKCAKGKVCNTTAVAGETGEAPKSCEKGKKACCMKKSTTVEM